MDRMLERDRRRADADGREAAETTANDVPAAILGLQRSAGNAAVGAWLGRAPAALVARDRKLPEEPTKLDDFKSVAKEIHFDDEVTFGSLDVHFAPGAGGHNRDGLSVSVRFPEGDLAAKKGDEKSEQRLIKGLRSIAVTIFGLHDKSKGAPRVDVVQLLDLNLSAFGGQDAHYRFASVARKFTGSGASKTPTEVDVTIEMLHPRRPPLQDWDKLSADRKTALRKRFDSFGFTPKSPGIDTSDLLEWDTNRFAKVMQALEVIPDDMLSGVRDIVWLRAMAKLGPKGEAGEYGWSGGPSPVRTIRLYQDAFSSDDELIGLIAHEVGHAISGRPAEGASGGTVLAASPSYRQAANLDGGLQAAVTVYGRTDWDEHYAEAYSKFLTEPETFAILRPNLNKWFKAQQDKAKPKPPAPAKVGAGAK
jgi:hypothetical protein